MCEEERDRSVWKNLLLLERDLIGLSIEPICTDLDGLGRRLGAIRSLRLHKFGK